MCEFLKGPNNNDVKKIKELSERITAEQHVCDALFTVLSDMRANPSSSKMREVTNLYSKMILARSTKDFTGIEDMAHEIIGVIR